MKWIEIIALRTSTGNRNALEQYLSSLCNDLVGIHNQSTVRIYENRDVDSDLSILLFHSTKKTNQKQSQLGYQIASMLRSFGLVSHTSWLEWKTKNEITNNSKENE